MTGQDFSGWRLIHLLTNESQLPGPVEFTFVTDGSADSQAVFFGDCENPMALLR